MGWLGIIIKFVTVATNMPPKKGKGKKAKKEGDEDTKAEKQRIIDEIYNAPDIEAYPMK